MKKIILLFISLFVFNTNTLAESIDLKFSRCIDGDTAEFFYNEEKIKVRLLAIDTPETVHPSKDEEPFGKLASDFTCKKITKAKSIILEFDKNSDKQDKYNRYLGWLFVDNKLLQKELIKNGLAQVAYLYNDYKYTEELKFEENIAKNKRINIWKSNDKNNTYYIYIVTIIILILTIFLIRKKTKH